MNTESIRKAFEELEKLPIDEQPPLRSMLLIVLAHPGRLPNVPGLDLWAHIVAAWGAVKSQLSQPEPDRLSQWALDDIRDLAIREARPFFTHIANGGKAEPFGLEEDTK